MDKPTAQQLVEQLLRLGCTQTEIAKACGTSQPTIYRILTGASKEPGYVVVDRLREFHAKKIKAIRALVA